MYVSVCGGDDDDDDDDLRRLKNAGVGCGGNDARSRRRPHSKGWPKSGESGKALIPSVVREGCGVLDCQHGGGESLGRSSSTTLNHQGPTRAVETTGYWEKDDDCGSPSLVEWPSCVLSWCVVARCKKAQGCLSLLPQQPTSSSRPTDDSVAGKGSGNSSRLPGWFAQLEHSPTRRGRDYATSSQGSHGPLQEKKREVRATCFALLQWSR